MSRIQISTKIVFLFIYFFQGRVSGGTFKIISTRKEQSAHFLQGFYQLSTRGLAKTLARPFNTPKMTFYTSSCFYDPLIPFRWVAWISYPTCAARWHRDPSWIYGLRPLQGPSQGGEGEGVDVGISCQTLSFIGVETEKVVSWSRRLVIPEF